jgi:hypothetical protein
MTTSDKRKHPRIDSLNLSYICVDEDNNLIKHGLGRTLNVSESGLLLETYFRVNPEHILLLTIGFEEELVDIKGEIIHSKEIEPDSKYELGIKFTDIDEEAKEILKRFIEAFHA